MITPTTIRIGRKYIELATPDPKAINWEDLALSLSGINRWLAHTEVNISVLHHSLNVWARVSEMTQDPSKQLAALIHDSHEAIVGDMPTPIKSLIPEFKTRLEDPWQVAVFQSLGLPPALAKCEEVRTADLEILVAEAEVGFGITVKEIQEMWGIKYNPPYLRFPLFTHVTPTDFLNTINALQTERAKSYL